MPVPTSLASLSTTAGSNQPSGGENPFPDLDDHIRFAYSCLAQLRDGKLDASAVSAFILTLLNDSNAATARATLGAASTGANTFTGGQTLPGNAVNPLEAVPLQQVQAMATGRLIAIRVFTVADTGTTYTPTPGTNAVDVWALGAGAGAGGTIAPGGGAYSLSCAGSGGSFGRGRYTSGFEGALLTISAGGLGGAPGLNSGNDGGATSFGSLLVVPGGLGGTANGAVASGGNWTLEGPGRPAAPTGANVIAMRGQKAGAPATAGSLGFRSQPGGNFLFDAPPRSFAAGVGEDAVDYGVGGEGSFSFSGEPALAGAKGGDGVIFVFEYS